MYSQCQRKHNEQEHHLAKVVHTQQEANNIFLEFHASAVEAHCGVDKTMHAILQQYYWPDIKDHKMGVCIIAPYFCSAYRNIYVFHQVLVVYAFDDSVLCTFQSPCGDGPCRQVEVLQQMTHTLHLCHGGLFHKMARSLSSKTRAEEVTDCIMDFF